MRNKKMFYTILAASFVALSIPAKAFAWDISLNTGMRSLAFIPTYFAELEIDSGDGSIRGSYFSNNGIRMFGSSVYSGRLLEISFLQRLRPEYKRRLFISTGIVNRIRDEQLIQRYKLIAGLGFERRDQKIKLFGQKHTTSVRFYIQYTQRESFAKGDVADSDKFIFWAPGFSASISL